MLAAAAAAIALVGASLGRAQEPQVHELAALGLTLSFPAQFELEADAKLGANQVASWSGRLGAKQLELYVLDPPHPDFSEPTEVTDRIRDNIRNDPRNPAPAFMWDSHELLPGNFGYAPFASLCKRSIRAEGQTNVATKLYYLGGLLEQKGYLVVAALSPGPSKEEEALLSGFFAKGIRYAGKVRDHEWTDEQARARWNADVPGADKKPRLLENVIRTEHYVILTNSSGGKLFAKKMEECYATIKKVYPFEDVAGQRLMPVFLFQMSGEYFDFFAKQFGTTLEQARKSKGVASGDFYATWYEAPADPVHIHEATHQIFRNRLFLHGGGSWFQEGVAEYIETKPNERNDVARSVEDGTHTPLREFVQIVSLLFSGDDAKTDKTGRNTAHDHYKQAALLIEFLRESKFGRDKFSTWLHAIGNVARNDVPAIEAATQAVYGVDLEGLDREFVAYCKKR